jgi:hypothetical protein
VTPSSSVETRPFTKRRISSCPDWVSTGGHPPPLCARGGCPTHLRCVVARSARSHARSRGHLGWPRSLSRRGHPRAATRRTPPRTESEDEDVVRGLPKGGRARREDAEGVRGSSGRRPRGPLWKATCSPPLLITPPNTPGCLCGGGRPARASSLLSLALSPPLPLLSLPPLSLARPPPPTPSTPYSPYRRAPWGFTGSGNSDRARDPRPRSLSTLESGEGDKDSVARWRLLLFHLSSRVALPQGAAPTRASHPYAPRVGTNRLFEPL